MITLFFRSSSLSQWDYCQMSYFMTYNLGWQQPPNKKAQLGTVVHKTLECLAQCKQRLQYGEKPGMRIEDGELGTIKFTNKQLYSNKFVIKLLDMSYEYYTTSDTHNQYNEKYDYEFCRQMVDACLEYNNGQFDPRNSRIVAPEKSFILEIDEPWATFDYKGQQVRLSVKGTMDLITEVAPDTLEYVDYKTGRRLNWATGEEKTYDKLHDDIQLLLYYYAMSKLYPQYDHIIMTIFFLRDGGPFSLCFDVSDNDKFLAMLKKKFIEIQANNLPRPINANRSDFRCTKLCHFYKNNWPDTNQNMCQYVENHVKLYGIEQTMQNCSRPGFEIGFYKAPGSVE